MSEAALLQNVCDTVDGFLQVGNEVFAADGAIFVRNRTVPCRYDANHVAQVRCDTGSDIERLLARAEQEFSHLRYRRFDVDPFTPPPFVARLALDDYTFTESVQLVLQGELHARPKPIEIRAVTTESDWSAYSMLQVTEWRESTGKQGRSFSADVAAEFVVSKRSKAPAVRYWLAYIDGTARGYACSWPGTNGIGIVEDLFTHPDDRHRGLATALIAHGVRDVRERGAGPIVIGADTTDTPKRMYAALGFRPLLVTRQYMRFVLQP